ncbi:hypothetical protein [Burkholderia territorii]|nr:hypothetical protein [Burkholderia territorii]
MENNRRKLIAASTIPLALSLLASKESQAQSSAGAISGLTVELGNSSQPNSAHGIDNGAYYQVDCRLGNAFNGFPYTANNDGTITLTQGGVYVVLAHANIVSSAPDTYQIPAQMTFAAGVAYPWPGIYQYSVQSLPAPVLGTQSTQSLGTINLVGLPPLGWGANSNVWIGYSKVVGTQNKTVLGLQGAVTILKIA